MRTPLTEDQIQTALEDLPGWEFENDRLKKTFVFESFRGAVGFIVRVAFSAEELNHHPELHNVYDRVEIALSTHDAGDKVTETDIRLAQAIEAFSWV